MAILHGDDLKVPFDPRTKVNGNQITQNMTWLEYLQFQYDDVRRTSDEARKAHKPDQAKELDHKARVIISLIKKPFYGVLGHEAGDPVPVLNRWLHERGLPSVDVLCSRCGNLRLRRHPNNRCPFPPLEPSK